MIRGDYLMRHPRRLAVLAIALVTLVLSACGAGQGVSVAARGTPSSQTNTTTTTSSAIPPTGWTPVTTRQTYDAGGEVLDPPPLGAVPRITFLDAFNLCSADPPATAHCGTGQTTTYLGAFSDNSAGTINPDGSLTHQWQGVLVWAMLWNNQTCVNLGGPPAPPEATSVPNAPDTPLPGDCQLVSFVDANSGQFLTASSQ
jgi:hypothetical protein